MYVIEYMYVHRQIYTTNKYASQIPCVIYANKFICRYEASMSIHRPHITGINNLTRNIGICTFTLQAYAP